MSRCKKVFQVHNYIVGRVLSKSDFSTVRLAQKKGTDKFCVVKIVKKGGSLDCLFNEGYLAPLLNNNNIVHVSEVVDSRCSLFQVSDYYEGGNLLNAIVNREFTLPEINQMMNGILRAVHYLHNHFICHRDIKLENVLLGSNLETRLADFGLASITFDGTVHGSRGSLQYTAPEVINQESYDGFKADIWSIGICFYCLLAKAFPYSNIKPGFDYNTPIDYHLIPQQYVSVIRSMLSIDPQKRPSIEALYNMPIFWRSKPKIEPINLNDPLKKLYSPYLCRLTQIL